MYELIRRRDAIDAQLTTMHEGERDKALEKIGALMAAHGLTVKHIEQHGKRRGRKAK